MEGYPNNPMRLSWNEIKARAARFAASWRDAHYERGESQTFYNEFFEIFGVTRRRVASFEEPVRKLGDQRGFKDHPEGRVLDFRGREFERLQRRINATQRNYQLALKQLENLPVAADQSEQNEQPAPEIGFDPEVPVNRVGQALPPALPTPEPPPPAPKPTPKPVETLPTPPPAAPGKVYRDLWTPRQDRKDSHI
jgi:hypothetical protein